MGEKVLFKLQPYEQQSVVSRPYPKLAFRVIEKVGSVAYTFELPAGSLIHPVFHVSQLKPFTPNYTLVFKELPKLVDMATVSLQPEAILDQRLVKKGSHAVPQVLVKWTNLPVVAATWEDLYVVKARFPDAVAWGQAISAAGGGVMTEAMAEAGTGEGVFIV